MNLTVEVDMKEAMMSLESPRAIWRSGTRRAFGAVVAIIMALGMAVGVAPAASAHSGPWELVVAPDGAGGLTAFGKYTEDGHVVTEILDPVATAVSADGTSVGPVALVSSAEGEGNWVTSAPFLTEGDWTVTVTTTMPAAVTATLAVQVAPVEPPVVISAAPDAAESADAAAPPADGSDAASATTESGSSLPTVLWIIAGVLLVAVVVVVIVQYRRTRTGGRSGTRTKA